MAPSTAFWSCPTAQLEAKRQEIDMVLYARKESERARLLDKQKRLKVKIANSESELVAVERAIADLPAKELAQSKTTCFALFDSWGSDKKASTLDNVDMAASGLWRNSLDRRKPSRTNFAATVLFCLAIGYDPPDLADKPAFQKLKKNGRRYTFDASNRWDFTNISGLLADLADECGLVYSNSQRTTVWRITLGQLAKKGIIRQPGYMVVENKWIFEADSFTQLARG